MIEQIFKLLLIDDDEDDWLITRDLLADMPVLRVELDWCSSAQDAYQLLKQNKYDLLLVDYRLGAVTGVELIEKLRQLSSEVPVILLTGQGSVELESKAIELGAADYLVKGELSADQLQRTLRYAIDRHKVQQSLAEKERRFYQLMLDSRDALMVLDDQSQIQFANPSAETLLGASVNTGNRLPFALPEVAGDLFELAVEIDGDTKTLEVQVSNTQWQESIMRLLSLRDVTARKEAAEKLHLYKRALDSSYNGIIIADARLPDLPVVYVNKSFERITGYQAIEVMGKNCRFLQGDIRDEKASLLIRQAIAEQKECHVLLKNIRKDGSAFWNSLYLAPVPDDDGKIHYYIGVQNDVSEQKRHEAELEYNANHDLLTGLPNRALLQDRLRQSCQVSSRYQRSVGVMFIDLDGFKLVNDSLGHSTGDRLLVEVANRISHQIRPGDTLARIGGDEFVAVLSDLAHEEDIVLIADRILEAMNQLFVIEQHEIHLSASIGITVSDGKLDEPMQLIQQADIAMFRAKQLGHNNYQWFSKELNNTVGKQLALRNQIQKALAAEEFELYYQPQIDARSGNVIALEALLRWPQAGENRFISPVEFIPIAEETGQIVPLSLWVFEQACHYIKTLLAKGMTDLVIAVNVSSTHFQRGNFVGSVEDILKRTALPPRHLELEITETVLFDNSESAIYKLGQLKALGVKISIDDFGTGFSSLNYLKLLPIDKIKIDRSFIQDIVSDQRDAAISKAIIAMAHLLGLKVIAEGVETESQVAFLRKSLCDEYQGYYFARPMPVNELEPFLVNYQQHAHKVTGEAETERQTLLLLDDEENILHALVRLLRRDNYQILTATTAEKAFELLALHDVQVILSDQRMPQMNGTEFLKRVKDLYPETIRIVLSGYTDLRSVTEAINSGAIYRFMTKPWNDVELRQEIQQAFVQYEKKKQVKDDR